jgi:hypothetical protein
MLRAVDSAFFGPRCCFAAGFAEAPTGLDAARAFARFAATAFLATRLLARRVVLVAISSLLDHNVVVHRAFMKGPAAPPTSSSPRSAD